MGNETSIPQDPRVSPPSSAAGMAEGVDSPPKTHGNGSSIGKRNVGDNKKTNSNGGNAAPEERSSHDELVHYIINYIPVEDETYIRSLVDSTPKDVLERVMIHRFIAHSKMDAVVAQRLRNDVLCTLDPKCLENLKSNTTFSSDPTTTARLPTQDFVDMKFENQRESSPSNDKAEHSKPDEPTKPDNIPSWLSKAAIRNTSGALTYSATLRARKSRVPVSEIYSATGDILDITEPDYKPMAPVTIDQTYSPRLRKYKTAVDSLADDHSLLDTSSGNGTMAPLKARPKRLIELGGVSSAASAMAESNSTHIHSKSPHSIHGSPRMLIAGSNSEPKLETALSPVVSPSNKRASKLAPLRIAENDSTYIFPRQDSSNSQNNPRSLRHIASWDPSQTPRSGVSSQHIAAISPRNGLTQPGSARKRVQFSSICKIASGGAFGSTDMGAILPLTITEGSVKFPGSESGSITSGDNSNSIHKQPSHGRGDSKILREHFLHLSPRTHGMVSSPSVHSRELLISFSDITVTDSMEGIDALEMPHVEAA